MFVLAFKQGTNVLYLRKQDNMVHWNIIHARTFKTRAGAERAAGRLSNENINWEVETL